MGSKSLSFMKKRCAILRPSTEVDVTTIRDRILTGYTTVKNKVPIYLEPAVSDAVGVPQLGLLPVDSFIGYVPQDTNIQVNDVIKIGGTYYDVRGVLNYSDYGFHMRIEVTQKPYFRGQ